MKQNQIKVKRIQTGTITLVTIKNDMVYDAFGRKNVYCGCTGNTVKTATPMEYADGEIFCPHCHEKKVEILQTYEQWKAEKDAEEKRRNEEKLENLHLVEAGSDWECGFKYYTLSAQIDYDDWLKVKEHFRYYRRGWSKNQELEWNYGEPTGWLTRNPVEVEKILVEAGLIKPENTMEAIKEREEKARQKREQEKAEKLQKRMEIKEKMGIIDEKIREAFNSEDARQLNDAEASHYYGGDYGRGTVCTYSITDTEIIKCRNMGDFTYAVAIPYSSNVENLIKDYYKLNEEVWNYNR